MKDLVIGWLLGLGLFGGCGYFLLGYMMEIVGHIRNYKREKADRQLRWWYLDWIFIVWEVCAGSLLRPSFIGCLIFCMVGLVLLDMQTVEGIKLLIP